MLYKINTVIEQNYQDILETQTLIQTTSDAAMHINPLYLSTTTSYNPHLQFTNVAWNNMKPFTADLDPAYHAWHPDGQSIAVVDGYEDGSDVFLHMFSFYNTDSLSHLAAYLLQVPMIALMPFHGLPMVSFYMFNKDLIPCPNEKAKSIPLMEQTSLLHLHLFFLATMLLPGIQFLHFY